MGELAASLAHEIKQPLSPLPRFDARVCVASARRRFISMCQRRAEGRRETYERRDTGRRNHRNARRRCTGKGTTPRERVNVNEVIREMVLLLQQEASASSIAIRTELSEGIPDVIADRVQLQQVLMNLMLNAIEAMKNNRRRPHSRLSCERRQRGVDRGARHGRRTARRQSRSDLRSVRDDQATRHRYWGSQSRARLLNSHGGRVWAERNAGAGRLFSLCAADRHRQVMIRSRSSDVYAEARSNAAAQPRANCVKVRGRPPARADASATKCGHPAP